MTNYELLKIKINDGTAKICLIGLGYVGLPLAVAFAEKNYFVYGFDTDQERINKLFQGERFIVDVDPKQVLRLIKKKKFYPTSNEKVIRDSDVIIIAVPTPLRKVKFPDISYVVAASRTVMRNMRKAQLIVLESTSYTTTTREVTLPILKESGLKEEVDFFLAFSPERVNPGDKKFPVTKIPKAIGGLSGKSSELAMNIYSKIVDKVFTVSSPEVAETSKLLENTFRLVNIALINEFAILCHKLGISIWEVIECAKTKPFGFMPFYPGPGIGGHCIPCDPVFLSWKAKKLGYKTKMIDLALEMNRYMPHYVVERVQELFEERNIALENSKILVLGVTYKKDVKDLRESPALEIIEDLQQKKVNVCFYDPYIPYIKIDRINLRGIRSLDKKTLRLFDCVLLVTDHSDVDYTIIQKNAKLIFDTRNVYKKDYPNVVKL
ncbi:MAG: nucleotide sugar dehydrogenase [Candidatus Omnitrophica bacterium]|nr:nucleotide sugar dehydrogenase [Candidatus Omnitrophota bacterium]